MDEALLDNLIDRSVTQVRQTSLDFVRSEMEEMYWSSRMSTLLGSRGTGKTTLILQRIKQEDPKCHSHLYLSLDDIHFNMNNLVDTVKVLRQKGYSHFYIDEIHKYPQWSREVKQLYDQYKDIHLVLTGSSMVEVLKGEADLSRRTVIFHLKGLSFRQFLAFNHQIVLPSVELETLLKEPNDYIHSLPNDFRPLQFFDQYLKEGYYPFFREEPATYHTRLNQMIRLILEYDLPGIISIDIHNTRKLLQLLSLVARNVPFKPNIKKLSERIGVGRNTLTQYLHYLGRADLLNLLMAPGKSISTLQKPDKIYLENTNLMYAMAPDKIDTGTLRETFALNQLSNSHLLHYPGNGDLLVDEKYTFEIGGPEKTKAQIKNTKNAYVLADQTEHAVGNKIPLWAMGMLY